MHVKAMEMAKWAMADACAKGYDCMTSQDWDDFKDCVETAKNAIKADYYYKIVECMNKDEEYEKEEEKYLLRMLKEEYGMEDDECRRYYDVWRYKSGRFAPKGRGTRKGYEEPPYYHTTPEQYKEHDAEYWRDVDRKEGRMYYTEPIKADGARREESKMERARRFYTEAKMAEDNAPEGKKRSMESLDRYMKELADDMTQLVGSMDASEKAMLKTRLQTLSQKIQ